MAFWLKFQRLDSGMVWDSWDKKVAEIVEKYMTIDVYEEISAVSPISRAQN